MILTLDMTSATYASPAIPGPFSKEPSQAFCRLCDWGTTMRVLHVISTAAEGGAEHQLRLLLRRLPHDSEVVTLSPPGAAAWAVRAGGVPVYELNTACDRDLAAIVRLRRLIRRGRYDLVHTHRYRACVHGRIAARLA